MDDSTSLADDDAFNLDQILDDALLEEFNDNDNISGDINMGGMVNDSPSYLQQQLDRLQQLQQNHTTLLIPTQRQTHHVHNNNQHQHQYQQHLPNATATINPKTIRQQQSFEKQSNTFVNKQNLQRPYHQHTPKQQQQQDHRQQQSPYQPSAYTRQSHHASPKASHHQQQQSQMFQKTPQYQQTFVTSNLTNTILQRGNFSPGGKTLLPNNSPHHPFPHNVMNQQTASLYRPRQSVIPTNDTPTVSFGHNPNNNDHKHNILHHNDAQTNTGPHSDQSGLDYQQYVYEKQQGRLLQQQQHQEGQHVNHKYKYLHAQSPTMTPTTPPLPPTRNHDNHSRHHGSLSTPTTSTAPSHNTAISTTNTNTKNILGGMVVEKQKTLDAINAANTTLQQQLQNQHSTIHSTYLIIGQYEERLTSLNVQLFQRNVAHSPEFQHNLNTLLSEYSTLYDKVYNIQEMINAIHIKTFMISAEYDKLLDFIDQSNLALLDLVYRIDHCGVGLDLNDALLLQTTAENKQSVVEYCRKLLRDEKAESIRQYEEKQLPPQANKEEGYQWNKPQSSKTNDHVAGRPRHTKPEPTQSTSKSPAPQTTNSTFQHTMTTESTPLEAARQRWIRYIDELLLLAQYEAEVNRLVNELIALSPYTCSTQAENTHNNKHSGEEDGKQQQEKEEGEEDHMIQYFDQNQQPLPLTDDIIQSHKELQRLLKENKALATEQQQLGENINNLTELLSFHQQKQ